MLRALIFLALIHSTGAEESCLLQARMNHSQKKLDAKSSDYPPLPDYLKNLGCIVFWGGEYVKCEGCMYDDTSVTTNKKVVHDGSISSQNALRIMTQSGIDVFSQLKVSGSSAWEFHGIQFDTKKTPIWESTHFQKELLKCGRKDAMVVYLRMRYKYPGSVFLTTQGRQELKSEHLLPAMSTCYTNFAYASFKAVLNELLAGMDEDAQIGIADSIISTLIFVPMLFLPEVEVSISLLSGALKELCEFECAEAIKLVPGSIKGNVLDPADGIISQVVAGAQSKTAQRVKDAISATDMILDVQGDYTKTVTAGLPSMTNQEIMYWIARFNTTNDKGNNCSVKGATKYVDKAVYWYTRINKMGFDSTGTRGREWISYYNGWCWKGFGKGSWYVEGMISSGYCPGHSHCELPDESKWERIPQEFMLTTIMSTPDIWTRPPNGDCNCEYQHPDCHTYFNQFPDSRRRTMKNVRAQARQENASV